MQTPYCTATCPGASLVKPCLCFPFAAFAHIDYDRHVVFDNSLVDGSWHYSRSHVVGPSELDLVDGKLPVDGSHYLTLTPPNALRLNWRSATGGDWNVTLDVRGRYGRVKFARLGVANVMLRRRRYFRPPGAADHAERLRSTWHSRYSAI